MRLLMSLIMAFVFTLVDHAGGSVLVYLETSARTVDELNSQLTRLSELSIRPRVIFPPNQIIASLYDAGSQRNLPEFVTHVETCTEEGQTQQQISRSPLAVAFRQPVDVIDLNQVNDLGNCIPENVTLGDSLHIPMGAVRNPMTNPRDRYTSNYFAGRTLLNIVFVESIGGTDNWTAESRQEMFNRLVQGMMWWCDQADDAHVNISFVTNVHWEILVTGEPWSEGAKPTGQHALCTSWWDFGWAGEAMEQMGYEGNWNGVFAHLNALRQSFACNWACEVFAVNSESSDDDHFVGIESSGYIKGYDEVGAACLDWEGLRTGQIVGLTYSYSNAVTRPTTFAHELAHVFGAADEYAREHGQCWDLFDCIHDYGYLFVNNGNCEACNPTGSVPCLMRDSYFEQSLCDWTLGHIGWRDADFDNVADAIKPTGTGGGGSGGSIIAIAGANPGDFIRIYTLDLDFTASRVLTEDDIARTETGLGIYFWDGRNFDGQKAAPGRYYYTINGGSSIDLPTITYDPEIGPSIVDLSHDYINERLIWKLDPALSWANVRCDIMRAGHPFVYHSRPLWDKPSLINKPDPETIDISYLEPGSYRADFYAWRPDGGNSGIVSYRFQVSPCYWLVGDADGSGIINVSDAVYLINYIFGPCEGCPVGPPPTPHNPGSGDADCNGIVTISDAVYIITYMFGGGPQPGLTCDCTDYY